MLRDFQKFFLNMWQKIDSRKQHIDIFALFFKLVLWKQIAPFQCTLVEKKHLSSVLVSNGYPSSFVQKRITKATTAPRKEPVAEFKSTAVLLYVQGVSEPVLNNKAFAPSSNPKRHLGHIWCDLRTPSIRLNKMAWFTGFPVNAVKSTSGK